MQDFILLDPPSQIGLVSVDVDGVFFTNNAFLFQPCHHAAGRTNDHFLVFVQANTRRKGKGV